jgi:ClpP class serine protease
VIDSPGGQVDGLFETIAAIDAFKATGKPLKVRASNAQSAAYALAAAAGRIEATSPASSFGSIGVAAAFVVSDKVVSVTSTDAPNKRPDVATDAGRAIVREQLDAIHELFVGAIAKGRGTTAAAVNKEFGRGATVLAGEARRRGMIDAIKPASTSGDSQMAMAERLSAVLADVRAGKIVERPGETKAAFTARIKAIANGELDLEAEVVGAPDYSDQVVARLEARRLGKAEAKSPTPTIARPPGKDLGDCVADLLQANRGK